MLFSTKAEYGVRLMVELGRRAGDSPADIAMLEIVQALEGPIAPMECFHDVREGRVLCSHETDGDRACATKLLWTRVHGGITRALSGTTLAELVGFADQHAARPLAGSAA